LPEADARAPYDVYRIGGCADLPKTVFKQTNWAIFIEAGVWMVGENIILKFTGGDDSLFNVDYWKFE
jgi:hypothetical protein